MVDRASVVAVLNRKGGSGKTTLAVNLAGVLAEAAAGRVILIDADPQGSAAGWVSDFHAFDVRHVPEVEQLGAAINGAAATGARFVVIDAPPYDAAATRAALERASLVVVPVTPSPLDLTAARPLLTTKAAPVLAVLSLTVPLTTATDAARSHLKGLRVKVAKSEIRRRIAHVRAVLARVPVTTYAPGSLAAAEVRAVGREVFSILRRGRG